MSKYFFAIVFFMIAALLLVILCLTIKRKSKHNAGFITLVSITLVLNLIYGLSIYTKDFEVLELLTHIWVAGVTWLVIVFVMTLSKHLEFKLNKWLPIVLIIVGIADTVLFIINTFNDIVVTCFPSYSNGEIYINADKHALYYIHLLFLYLLLLIPIIPSIKKITSTAEIYKSKYISILTCIIGVLIAHVLYTYTEVHIDFSLIFYGVSIVALYYYIFHHSPNTVENKIQSLIMTNMTDSIIVYDSNGNNFYYNLSAKAAFGDDASISYEEFRIKYLNKINPNQPEAIIVIMKNNNHLFYNIKIKRFYDKNERLQAFYIWFKDLTKEMNEVKEKQYRTTHDILTGAFNRDYFIEEATERIKNGDLDYMVIASNFESFRLLNDLYGSHIGDEVLIKMANLLKELSIKYDFVYARMGADKFGLFISSKTFSNNNILKIITKEFNDAYSQLPISIKFGICKLEDDSIIKAYDRAISTLHFIKGKSITYGFYDSEVRNKIVREQVLLKELDSSIENRYFEVYYQPQINSYNNSIIGAEALVRWKHPTFGMISPGEFIPLFETHSVISKLDLYVWEEACKFLQKWNHDKYANLSISVNISQIDFYNLDIPTVLYNLIQKYNVQPNKLKLEITETAFISDQEKLIIEIEKLQKLGFTVEMDDFGSGYSSLNVLKDIPIDIIKLDMKFLKGKIDNPKTINILDSIVSMAHKLHLPVIAEGVENVEQKDMLNSMNCELIQGYLYARPMPEPDFEKYLEDKTIDLFESYWNIKVSDKELFTILKDLDKSYATSPVNVFVLSPELDEDKNIKDILMVYSNRAFKRHEELTMPDMFKTSFNSFSKKVSNEWINFYQKIIKTRKDDRQLFDSPSAGKVHIHAYPLGTTNYICCIITFINE